MLVHEQRRGWVLHNGVRVNPRTITAFDVTDPLHAYFFGLIVTDGSFYEHSRNRGHVTVSLNANDGHVLQELAASLPHRCFLRNRNRKTNFGISSTLDLTISDWNFRTQLRELGLEPGKKSHRVSVPAKSYDEPAFWRGVIDGDGSLGFDRTNRPWVSFVTASEELQQAFADLIRSKTGRESRVRRNARDDIYNIMLWNEDARALTEYPYPDGCISSSRKFSTAVAFRAWRRPAGLRKMARKRTYTADDDAIILANEQNVAAAALGITVSQVSNRRFRLRSGHCSNIPYVRFKHRREESRPIEDACRR